MSLTALKDKKAISLKGKVKCIHHTYLDEIFQKNTYMQKIYPENTRDILEVFCLYEATGEYFDKSCKIPCLYKWQRKHNLVTSIL